MRLKNLKTTGGREPVALFFRRPYTAAMISSSLRSRRAWTVITAAILTLNFSCEDKRRHQASEHVEFPLVQAPVGKDATADATALALLDALRSLQRIRAVGFGVEGNKEKYDQAMGLIASLMEKDTVFQKARSDRTVPRDLSRDAAVRLVAESWASIVAHYVEGIDAGTVTSRIFRKGATLSSGAKSEADLAASSGDESRVHVAGENPGEREALAKIESRLSTSATPRPNEAALRAECLKQGFNYPIGARFAIRLTRTPEGWRATRLHIEGPAHKPSATAPVVVSIPPKP